MRLITQDERQHPEGTHGLLRGAGPPLRGVLHPAGSCTCLVRFAMVMGVNLSDGVNLLVRLLWTNLLFWLLRVLPARMHAFVVRALPNELSRDLLESVIEEYEDRGEDVLADLVERILRDPDQRQRVMPRIPPILLVPISPAGIEVVERPGASRNLLEAYIKVFIADPALFREVLRQGLAGEQAEVWRTIGWRFGVSFEEQDRLRHGT